MKVDLFKALSDLDRTQKLIIIELDVIKQQNELIASAFNSLSDHVSNELVRSLTAKFDDLGLSAQELKTSLNDLTAAVRIKMKTRPSNDDSVATIDEVKSFINSELHQVAHHKMRFAHIYDLYLSWCDLNKKQKASRPRFGAILNYMGFRQNIYQNKNYRMGLAPKGVPLRTGVNV